MTAPADSEDIWNEAMALLLQWQAAPDDDASREAVRRFCAQGAGHRAAWDEARRVFRLTGDAVGAGKKAKGRAVSRRNALAGLGAVAVGAAVLTGPDLWRRWRSDVTTGVAEMKRLQLPDGSWLTLGPESAVKIAFTPKTRRVDLIDGMALCEAAEDIERPFEAQAGGLLATAMGAAFEVRKGDGRCLVGAEAGRVQVAIAAIGGNDAALEQGDWLALGPDDQIQRGHRDPGQTAAWRQNLLIADHEEIGRVAAEIGRWLKGAVIVPQSSLASAPVSGLFDLRDPDAALAAVVGPYGGKVRRLSPWLTVLTTI